jgi:hypothetical protein
MADNIQEIKRKLLEQRCKELTEELEAVYGQLSRTQDDGMVLRLKRQIANLDKQLSENQSELDALSDVATPLPVLNLPPPEPAHSTPPSHLPDESPAPPVINTPPISSDLDTPPTSPVPDTLPASPPILELIWDSLKYWLWVQFLSWTVFVIGLVSGLTEIFDFARCTRLTISTVLLLSGGAVILGISIIRPYRARHRTWDRGLTAFALIVIVILLTWNARQTCTSALFPSTSSATVTPSLTPVPSPDLIVASLATEFPTPLPTETSSPPTPAITSTLPPTTTSLNCGVSHSPISGTDLEGSVMIANISFTGDCLDVIESRLPLDLRWHGVAPGSELWLLVYSPLAKLYFPHYCVMIQNPTGGQTCQVLFNELEPYEVIVILADASAHADLLDIANRSSGVKHEDLPTGIREMNYISVVRTK